MAFNKTRRQNPGDEAFRRISLIDVCFLKNISHTKSVLINLNFHSFITAEFLPEESKFKCCCSCLIWSRLKRNRCVSCMRTVPNRTALPWNFRVHRIRKFLEGEPTISFSRNYCFELLTQYCAGSKMRWAGHVARMGEGIGVHRFLMGKPEWNRPLGRPRRRWKDNIKMDFQEVGGGCGDWLELTHVRERWRALMSTVRKLRVPKMRGISWLAAEPVSFSRRTLLHGVSK